MFSEKMMDFASGSLIPPSSLPPLPNEKEQSFLTLLDLQCFY